MTETQRRTENLQRAYVVYRALAAACEMLFQPTTTESGMIVRLCQTLIQDTDFCAVWLAHPGTDGVFLSLGRAVQKPEDEQWLDGLHLTAQDHDSTIARVWRTQTPVIHEDLISGRDCEADARLVGRLGGASVLAVPVERAGEPWAVLVFIARHPFAFDEATQSACEQVAVLLRYALEEVDRKRVQSAQQDSESRRARTDPLTGLPNRLALDEHLPGALARARRRQKTVAVGILDLDDFKPVNDRFGHAAGDVLLRRFVDMLRARLRETDFLARIGGDEFVIVSEDLDPDQVMDPLGRALERVHTAVEAPFDLGHGRSAQVGMTMGIALYPQEAEEADALLHLADTAMYACKVDKMDRTRWWHAGAKGFDLGAESARESVLEPFGLAASLELQLLDARVLDAAATTFATAFYDELAQEPELASVLDCLSPDEFDHLKQKQAAHLLFLLQPEMTRHTLEENARKLGQIHALVGISGASLERTFTLYEDLLRKELDNTPLTARVRYRILRVATARLRLDIQAQLTAMDQIIGAYFSRLHAPTPTHARWIDTLGDLLDDLVALPGIRHAAVLRPDERGVLHMVAGAGADFDRVMGTIEREELYPNLNPSPGVERGPLAMA